MKSKHLYVVFFLLIIWQSGSSDASISMGVMGIGAFGAALYAGMDKVRCSFYECCSSTDNFWARPNMTYLEHALQTKLHGQHFVHKTILNALKSHLGDVQPSKALVMSFHGVTGSGKNHVSKLIAESIYRLGMRSRFVHLFVSTIHFPHKHMVDIYKLQVQDWIRGNVSNCERSMFIFDEIDKMPVKMIDSIKAFIDYHEQIFNVDFRKTIFIFLSQTGSKAITLKMLDMWAEGRKRTDIKMKDMEDLVHKGALNEIGGLHFSDLIQHSLVDYYVPFLPLERRQVEQCARDELIRRNHRPNPEFIKMVADLMTYYPAHNPLYSTTGCKKVTQKVGLVLTQNLNAYEDLFD